MASVLAIALGAGAAGAQQAGTLSDRTGAALLHVVAHEIGHAFIREFDLPILGPEEALADDFATVYIHQTFPDRAAEIVAARAYQNLADGQVPGMFSEYSSDEQRAGRSVCLLYGLDPQRHEALANEFRLDGDAAASCRDFATEVGRGWRRLLAQYRMPPGERVTEAGVSVADTPMAQAFAASGLVEPAYTLLSQIDWHSRITIEIDNCDGSASWSRNGRRITLCDSYIETFERQLRP